MALLVKELKALEQLEQAIVTYYAIMLGEELIIDRTKSIEERLLFLSAQVECLL